MPPNGQGLTALVLLNILEHFDLAALDPLGPERFHLMLEAARLAYAVRDTHIADPAHMRAPVPALNDKAFARTLARRIDPARRVPLPSAPSPGSDTVYLTVVDRDRMAVSLINSLFSHFGVGICTEKTGVMLTNRGACFVLDPDHPNTFGPGKRPMHTIIPALAMRDGRCDMAFGVMGAHYQPMGHVQIVTNMVDYGMDVQGAIDAPRAFFVGEQTAVERGMPAATVGGLRRRGAPCRARASPWGGGQAIKIDWQRGVLIGGSEPRKDGCALGQQYEPRRLISTYSAGFVCATTGGSAVISPNGWRSGPGSRMTRWARQLTPQRSIYRAIGRRETHLAGLDRPGSWSMARGSQHDANDATAPPVLPGRERGRLPPEVGAAALPDSLRRLARHGDEMRDKGAVAWRPLNCAGRSGCLGCAHRDQLAYVRTPVPERAPGRSGTLDAAEIFASVGEVPYAWRIDTDALRWGDNAGDVLLIRDLRRHRDRPRLRAVPGGRERRRRASTP